MPTGVYKRTEYHKLINSESHKGIKYSLEGRQNISESLIGREFSEEHKQNISKGRMGIEFSKKHKQNIIKSRLGSKASDETKNNMSKTHRKRFSSMTKEERRNHPWVKAGIIASQLANPSLIEKMIWEVLDEFGIEYEIQVPFANGRFIVDIYVPKWKLIIECNGSYYHNYILFPEKKVRDKALEKCAIRKGYKIIWLWEHDIRKNSRQILLIKLKINNIYLERG